MSLSSLVIERGSDWIVIAKPHELSTHNADSSANQQDAIQLTQDILKELKIITSVAPIPVHRLDAGTSGVLLIALSQEKAKNLAEEFAHQRVQKKYIAVLKGIISAPIIWDFPLTEKAEGRRDPAGSGNKKSAVTHVVPLHSNKYFTLAEIDIETGRTHQIRRHAAIAKHPVIGDARYVSPDYIKKIIELYKFERMALHAHELTIKIDGVEKIFKSPVPEAFNKIIQEKL